MFQGDNDTVQRARFFEGATLFLLKIIFRGSCDLNIAAKNNRSIDVVRTNEFDSANYTDRCQSFKNSVFFLILEIIMCSVSFSHSSKFRRASK